MKNQPMDFKMSDITLFYMMLRRYSNISDVVGVLTMTVEELVKKLKSEYPNHLIVYNAEKKSVIVTKEDYLKTYVVMNTITELLETTYYFERYM